MQFRKLGNTGLEVSEIGLGGEWLERHSKAETQQVIDCCAEQGINILDCWMSNPTVRENIGAAIKKSREHWLVQGHIGSTWQNGQYVRTREMSHVKQAFSDLLKYMDTDYIDLGMIHYIDDVTDYQKAMQGEFYEYVSQLKAQGAIRHIGLSTHSPLIAKMAAESGQVELLLFSLNPAFDMISQANDVMEYFGDEIFKDRALDGIAPERRELYNLCEQRGIAINVMKGYAGGRLFSAETSPFGVALTPVQCLHYCLTRPAVCSVMVGFDTPEHVSAACAYETANAEERDYAGVLASAPHHAFFGQCTYCGHCAPCPKKIDIALVNKLYDLAVMQPQVPDSVRGHYQCMAHKASECLACHACEQRCPFGVKIVERLQLAAQILG